jgi:hypothetical protein
MIVILVAIIFCILCGLAQSAVDVQRCPHQNFVNKYICPNCVNVAATERFLTSNRATGTYREIYYTDRAITNYSDKKKRVEPILKNMNVKDLIGTVQLDLIV